MGIVGQEYPTYGPIEYYRSSCFVASYGFYVT